MVNVYIASYLYNSNNLNKPLTRYFIYNWSFINLNLKQYLGSHFEQIFFLTDIGFLLEDIDEITKYDTSKLTYSFTNRVENDCFYNFGIEGNRLAQEFHRSYEKIQDVLTKIGGIIKALMIVGTFLAEVCSKIEYYIYLNLYLKNSNNFESFQPNLSNLEKTQKTNLLNMINSNHIKKDLENDISNNLKSKLSQNLNQSNLNLEENSIKKEFKENNKEISEKKENKNIKEKNHYNSNSNYELNMINLDNLNNNSMSQFNLKDLNENYCNFIKQLSQSNYNEISFTDTIVYYLNYIFCYSSNFRKSCLELEKIISQKISVENFLLLKI